MDRNEILKKLPLELTWRQAARLIGDEVVLPLWRASGEALDLDATLNATDCVRLADAVVKSGKPLPSDIEKNEWHHDRRKRRSTEHVRSDEPGALQKPTNKKEPDDTPEESLSDTAAAYRDSLTYAQEAWRIPGRIAEDARRKKQYYNARGQEEGYSEEDDPERSTSDAGKKNGTQSEKALSDDCTRARNEYIDRVTSMWKTCGR